MLIRVFPIFVTVLGIFVGPIRGADIRAQEISFTNLPTVDFNYKVDPYIKVAAQLQDLGQERATQQLIRLARRAAIPAFILKSTGTNTALQPALTESFQDSFDDEQRVAILCRMLFTNRLGSVFESPHYLGAPEFWDGFVPTNYSAIYSNWSKEPIELVDGIPFSVVCGYGYEGIKDPQSAESYVRYCMTNCEWSSFHFAPKSRVEKKQALMKLINSPK